MPPLMQKFEQIYMISIKNIRLENVDKSLLLTIAINPHWKCIQSRLEIFDCRLLVDSFSH